MRYSTLVFISFFVLSTQQLAADNLHNYVFSFLGRISNEAECITKITKISESLAQSAGVVVTGAACSVRSSSFNILDGVVEYVREEPLEFTSSVSNPYFVEDAQGMYDKIEDCQADKTVQVELFTQSVGLVPFVAECFESQLSSSGPKRYGLKMDAVGNTEVKGFLSGLSVYGRVFTSFTDFSSSLKAGFEQYGLKVHSIALAKQMFSRVMVGYYGKQRIPITEVLSLNYKNQELCFESKNMLDTYYASANLKPILTYCEQGLGNVGLRIVSKLEDRVPNRFFRKIVRNFSSLESCISQISEVLESTNANIVTPYIGGVCGEENSSLVMYLFRDFDFQTN